MAYINLKNWSTTAGSNATVGSISWAEGMAPSVVNDSARYTMADVASWYQASYANFNARLTLTSATPVTTSDVTAAGTIYLTPYKGNQIWLYDGSAQWNLFNLTEISLALTATSGKPYDVFCYDNAGTPTLETLVWTNGTTRATALALQNGIYVKTGATTRRYVGTFYANGSNTTEDSAANRYLWNYYNRALRPMAGAAETTDTWTYSTATWRQANANTANQLNYAVGVVEDAARAFAYGMATSGATAPAANVAVGIGVDSTSANSAQVVGGRASGLAAANDAFATCSAAWSGYPGGVGARYLAWLEISQASGTTTWHGDGGIAYRQSGIVGEVWA